ncbi:MAG TPA: 6-phosphofructokinase [Anaerolineae bacterium]|nr:6-phosphofructokinase [Anaerolineae bacterium]
MPTQTVKSLGILTSGADAPGMNAAVRAAVRTALHHKLRVYAINEGYEGLIRGGNYIKMMSWDSVGGILQRGGTILGSAQCPDFFIREGRRQAALNLIKHEIDSLVVIGGDGSLTGASLFREEWPALVAELVEQGQISQAMANRHSYLALVGLSASIDNDMAGTDITIGADTALHRITTAIDRISSTAASHQRSFVLEVIGYHSGYLALMGALASGADWVLIPESPPDTDDWEETMCQVLKAGRKMGRRDSIVVVAEGAQDRYGQPIRGSYVKKILEERLGEDTRLTVLGHVQRGGAPSAFDRYLATILGHAAVEELLSTGPEAEPQLLGLHNNRITRSPLSACVQQTRAITDLIVAKDYKQALDQRGNSFKEAFSTLRTLVRALPHEPQPGQQRLRLAVMTVGSLAPGMNTAARAATRLGIDQGHTVLGIRNGFRGFVTGEIEPLDWMDVDGWAPLGGSELGTNRQVPERADFYAMARNIETYNIQGLIVIGGWTGYQTAYQLLTKRGSFPAFNIPIICLPATINNNLPGAEISVGADTAMNNILGAVDKIKQSAVAIRRCFIVEVMGRYCGYLALMSGLATGAERVYLHEEGVKLANLQADLSRLKHEFEQGKRLGLIIRNEYVNPLYDAQFITSLFEQESGTLFDVRQAILGHLQRGGDPSPYDRIQAPRLAARCVEFLVEQAASGQSTCAFIGLQAGQFQITSLQNLPLMADTNLQRPNEQWWLDLRPVANVLT